MGEQDMEQVPASSSLRLAGSGVGVADTSGLLSAAATANETAETQEKGYTAAIIPCFV